MAGAVIGYLKLSTLTGLAAGGGIGLGSWLTLHVILSIRKGIRVLHSGISDIDKMSGVQFEEYLKILFKNRGYSVTLTPASNDYGADLIMKKGNNVIVVQAKRYRQVVGIKAVQEVIPAMKYYNATAACVVTNSQFTRQALSLAKHNQVKMIGRKELMRLIADTKKHQTKNPEKVANGTDKEF